MTENDETPVVNPFEGVPDVLAAALVRHGFESLTAVQRAVVDAPDVGRDLRIVSRTGSGKTVALGLAIGRAMIARGGPKPKERGVARPEVLVVAPTRELAAQVGRELSWLFAGLRLKVVTVTGGTNVGGDFRALHAAPDVLVGTPGRIVDHLERGSLELGETTELVLDEADAMLDLGFRDELELLLARLPKERTTHLVSATFADEVLALANRNQRDPKLVQGGDSRKPHADIEHLAYLVRPDDRPGAMINLLLASPDDRTLVFVRTRADATEVADGLAEHGFRARAISGEMTQRERTATLEAFRSGAVRVLVATDVAARGLDVQDIARVVHYDVPGSPETLTHRSGRTGRAGKKGTSVTFVLPAARAKAGRMFQQAGIRTELRPLPTRAEVAEAMEARTLESIRGTELEPADAERYGRIAASLLASEAPEALIVKLLSRSGFGGPCEPRDVASLDPVGPKRPRDDGPRRGPDARGERPTRGPDARGPMRMQDEPSFEDRAPRARDDRGASPGYVRFQVSWGARDGADARRLLAVSCRRGDVTSAEVGAIRVLDRSAIVEITERAADHFAASARHPDPREPHVKFRPYRDEPPARGPGAPRPGGKAPKRKPPR